MYDVAKFCTDACVVGITLVASYKDFARLSHVYCWPVTVTTGWLSCQECDGIMTGDG